MKWSRSRIRTALTVAVIASGWGGLVLAQENAPPPPGPLGDMIGARSEGNDQAADVQVNIDGISDETSDLLAQYRTTVKQIDAIDLYNSQIQNLILSQQKELESLKEQVARVQEVGRSVTPLMLRMIDAMERTSPGISPRFSRSGPSDEEKVCQSSVACQTSSKRESA